MLGILSFWQRLLQEVRRPGYPRVDYLTPSGSDTWKDGPGSLAAETRDEFENVKPGRGKLSPTSSHLFKLILPLGHLSSSSKIKRESSPLSKVNEKSTPPTVILLHPSQPLSHVSRLILASLAPATPEISFRSNLGDGEQFQWSDSTDIGDFVKDAAHDAKFQIYITFDSFSLDTTDGLSAKVKKTIKDSVPKEGGDPQTVIEVDVPTFADRTHFIQRRLDFVTERLKGMEKLKKECDHEAHRGARRMAVTGFGMLVVYWGAVARLTFWDWGWEIMEPITYLSGLSTIICGYLWFLYQGREVSYSTVLETSISSRREVAYKARGLDIDRWLDLVAEQKALKREIHKISEDYETDTRKNEDAEEDAEKEKEKENRKKDKADLILKNEEDMKDEMKQSDVDDEKEEEEGKDKKT